MALSTGRDSVRFTVLDSWRGLCALWVVLFHFRIVSHIRHFELPRHGTVAVEFFFVLSGFVLTSAYGDRLGDGASRLRFLIRRLGRLYPLHLFTLAVVVAMECARWLVAIRVGHPLGGALFSDSTDPATLIPNLLLAHGWGFIPQFTWNVPSWSISVEFLLCLLFVAASFSPRRLATYVALVLIGLLAFIYTWRYLPVTESKDAVSHGVYAFFLGCALHYVYRWWKASGRGMPGLLEWLAIPILYLAPKLDSTPLPTPMFGLLILVFAFESGPISRVLNHAAPRFLGEVSYSIYLIHYVLVLVAFGVAAMAGDVVNVAGAPWIGAPNAWAGDLATILFLGLVVGVSALSYRFIERPGRDLFNRLSDLRATAATT